MLEGEKQGTVVLQSIRWFHGDVAKIEYFVIFLVHTLTLTLTLTISMILIFF